MASFIKRNGHYLNLVIIKFIFNLITKIVLVFDIFPPLKMTIINIAKKNLI